MNTKPPPTKSRIPPERLRDQLVATKLTRAEKEDFYTRCKANAQTPALLLRRWIEEFMNSHGAPGQR